MTVKIIIKKKEDSSIIGEKPIKKPFKEKVSNLWHKFVDLLHHDEEKDKAAKSGTQSMMKSILGNDLGTNV